MRLIGKSLDVDIHSQVSPSGGASGPGLSTGMLRLPALRGRGGDVEWVTARAA